MTYFELISTQGALYVAGAFLHALDKSYSVRGGGSLSTRTHIHQRFMMAQLFFLPSSSSSLSLSCINPLEDPNSLLILSASFSSSFRSLSNISELQKPGRQVRYRVAAYFMSFNFLLSCCWKNIILCDNKKGQTYGLLTLEREN